MGIIIDGEKCISCGKCRNICPGNLIRKDTDGRAVMSKPKDCWSCASCVKECPAGAIALIVSPEMGGRGAELSVFRFGKEIRWQVKRNKEEIALLVTNADEANRY